MAKENSNLVFSIEADEACAWLAIDGDQASITLSGVYDLQANLFDKASLRDIFAKLGPDDVWQEKADDLRLNVTVKDGNFQAVLHGGTNPVTMIIPLDYILGRLV